MDTEPTPAPATPGTAQASIILSLFKRIARKFIVFFATAAECAGFRAAFDIEADGLHDASRVHCISVVDLDNDNPVEEYGPNQIAAALKRLSGTTYLTGHNIIGYDLPTLQRLHDWAPPASCTIVDTMVAARTILPNLDDIDDQIAAIGKVKMGKLRGRYSIEAFAMRLGLAKIGADIEDFSEFTAEMMARNANDTLVCKRIWQFLRPDSYPAEALELEHRVSRICSRITADGVPFDVNAAKHLQRQWTERRAELGAQLSKQFPGVNLNSRQQLGALLEAKGWLAPERTPKTNQPRITDEVLETIPQTFPEFSGLAEYDILRRRLAQLSDGNEAWLKHVDAKGKIHCGVVHVGTPHGRAKHVSPNLAQTPNPKRGKVFAAECRGLFRTNNDWVFVCCDQAGLQDRAIAHYLFPFDQGAYAKAYLTNGFDPHWKSAADLNLIANGATLDKQNKVHAALREGCKSFRYGFFFGTGAPGAGHIVNNIIRTVQHIDANSGLQKQFFGETRPNETKLKQIGKVSREKFEAGIPGLRRLRANLQAHVEDFGYLKALDQRRVPCSAQYKALNFQVTSAEAVICKRWLANVFDELNQKYRYGWEGDCTIVLWIHDEIAVCCRPEIADEVGKIMVKYAREPGEFYGLKLALDAEYKISKSWAGEPGPSASKPPNEPPNEPPSEPPVEPMSALPPKADIVHTSCDESPSKEVPTEDRDFDPSEIEIEDLTHININAIKAKPVGNGRDFGYPHGEARKGRRITEFLYRNHLGEPHTKVEKRAVAGKHSQYPQSFYVAGKWVRKKPAGWMKVPFRLPELLETLAKKPDTDVYIPEGEKDAETLAALGLVATTSSEGASNPKSKKGSNWTAELNKWFAGVKRAFILEDNDEPGRNFAREKASALAGIIPDIRIVSFPDVPETEDVTWWINEGKHTKDELIARCEGTAPWQGGQLDTLCAEEVKLEAIDWCWFGRFALGKLGIIAGLPDEGKSSLLCYIASRLTNSKLEWPNGEGRPPRCGTVLMLTSEDSPADTLVPRLVANDADLSRVQIIQMVHDRNIKDGRERERMFSMADDIGLLRQKIKETGDVIAILIDPITAYLGSGKGAIDSFRDTDVRAVLGPLVHLAVEYRIAVISIMHFNKKVDVTNALLRISNSLAFGGVARHVFAVTKDADNARRLMTRAKNNIASEEENKTLAFHFDTKEVGKDWRDGRSVEAPFIVWEPGYVDVTATQALAAVNENKAPSALNDAKDFLRDILIAGGGRALAADIEEAADAEKISDRTLRRAKKVLKVRAEKDRSIAEGGWFWVLPDDDEEGGS